ncbi:hypothetical protein [Roseateles sp.]|uniref:hypothetical protein n=1 Tax=Roseateles sp. TaxID=1971397 RepID=UPI003D0BFDBB
MSANAGPERADVADAARRQEWLALFKAHEQYELAALALKLFAMGLCAAVWGAPWLWALLILAWLQEAVLKTFQARLSNRLLGLEQALRRCDATSGEAMQLHSEWLQQRPGGLGLLLEYLKSALRPTVALPYPILLALLAWY